MQVVALARGRPKSAKTCGGRVHLPEGWPLLLLLLVREDGLLLPESRRTLPGVLLLLLLMLLSGSNEMTGLLPRGCTLERWPAVLHRRLVLRLLQCLGHWPLRKATMRRRRVLLLGRCRTLLLLLLLVLLQRRLIQRLSGPCAWCDACRPRLHAEAGLQSSAGRRREAGLLVQLRRLIRGDRRRRLLLHWDWRLHVHCRSLKRGHSKQYGGYQAGHVTCVNSKLRTTGCPSLCTCTKPSPACRGWPPG